MHGAAGGVGTAALQVAKALGASTIAVVSSEEKERVARDAGADDVLRSDGPWREQALELSGGGVDVVLDPVGGDRFTDRLRSLKEEGRVLVVGFTEGINPRGKGQPPAAAQRVGRGRGLGRICTWQSGAQSRDRRGREQDGRRRVYKTDSRGVLSARQGGEALRMIDERRAVGKVVLNVA